MSVDIEKKELRLAAKGNRLGLAREAGPEAAEKLAANFFQSAPGLAEGSSGPGSPEQSPAVAGYWPMADEIDVRPLMTGLFEDGWTVALPVVVAKEEPLVFRRWQPGMALEAGRFGTCHPGPGAPEIVPDILLVPLLAFDDKGFRLGWGGGFYDRTLSRLRAAADVTAVGIAYQGQKVDSVPHSSNDEPLDWIVTDEGILEIARK